MLVTTHTMVAMSLMATTGNPFVYVPAAIVNHPILDMIPHFGFSKAKYPKLRSQAMWPMIIMDAILGTSLFFVVLKFTHLPFWPLFGICLLAAWPDLFTLYQRKVNPKLAPKFLELHENIQNESPWFIFVELGIVILCLYLIIIWG